MTFMKIKLRQYWDLHLKCKKVARVYLEESYFKLDPVYAPDKHLIDFNS